MILGKKWTCCGRSYVGGGVGGGGEGEDVCTLGWRKKVLFVLFQSSRLRTNMGYTYLQKLFKDAMSKYKPHL